MRVRLDRSDECSSALKTTQPTVRFTRGLRNPRVPPSTEELAEYRRGTCRIPPSTAELVKCVAPSLALCDAYVLLRGRIRWSARMLLRVDPRLLALHIAVHRAHKRWTSHITETMPRILGSAAAVRMSEE